jgi:hypothetical protein
VRAAEPVAFRGVKAAIKGRSEPLEVQFEAFDPRTQSLTVLFLVQVLHPARRTTAAQMADAVVKMAEAREGKRRFAAYSFANNLDLVADFGASKGDFERLVRAVRAINLPIQLYKTTLEAVAKLANEPGDRKAMVILGDGAADGTGYTHEQVVKAARDAGIAIHALGYIADTADLPKFQNLQRLARDTGGFRREVRVGAAQRYTLTGQFVPEVLENGGTAKLTLREPPGATSVNFTADFNNGRSASVDQAVTVPGSSGAPSASQTSRAPPGEGSASRQGLLDWARENSVIALMIGMAVGLAALGLALFVFSPRAPRVIEETPLDTQGRPYGWLEAVDGGKRYPLMSTNVRIGRHLANDICLQNDSVSRQHALLHFSSANRQFVITDLGGGNGVIVNQVNQTSHVLHDGDIVELGEVHLRFRTNKEVLGG